MFGMFYDGKTSRPNPCSLHVDEQGLVQISGFPFVPVSVQRISVTDRVGNTPRFVFFPDGASFETDDQQAADELAKSVRVANQAKPKRWFDAHRLESSFKLAVLSLVISLAILYVMATYGVPAASRWAALQLPEQASHALGDGMMELLDDEYLGPTELSEARQASLTALFDQLIPKPTEVEYKLHFRKGEWIGANALALPGGDIVITDELIKLAKSDDAIRGVLLHEIAHVKYRHSLIQVIQSAGLVTLASLMLGDLDAVNSLIVYLPVVLVQRSYSRDAEWEADGYALTQMAHTSTPTGSFADLMASLGNSTKPAADQSEQDKPGESTAEEKEENDQVKEEKNQEKGILDYLSTHPHTAERVERIRNFKLGPE